MRLIADARVCQVPRPLFPKPGRSATQFRAETDGVQSDLNRFKKRLET